MKDFRSLSVWHRAHALAPEMYRGTREFPREERCGPSSQLRRAPASIAANIAEGCGRDSDVDFARMLRIASGSASEVQYLLILAGDLALITAARTEPLTSQVTEVKRMLSGLTRRLAGRQPAPADG